MGSSVSSHTRSSTDNENYQSLKRRKPNRFLLLNLIDGGEGSKGRGDSSSPSAYNGLNAHSNKQARICNTSSIGPTTAFLNVLSRSSPVAFVSSVRNASASSTQTSTVNRGRHSIASITSPSSLGNNYGDLDSEEEGIEHSDLAAELACAHCCHTVGTLIFRLYALKDFITELGWPDRVRAAGWAESTRKMCSSLLREAAKRWVDVILLVSIFLIPRMLYYTPFTSLER